jgi:ribonuclease HI
MPSFQCQSCNTTFRVPQSALDKYPAWKPKFCREHSPKKNPSDMRRVKPFGRGRGAAREEHLTLAQVLEKYQDGPQHGVFTDGSSIPNPGRGGWGFVWVEEGEVREQRHGQEPATTNNRMELQALIEAYKLLPADENTTLFTDSRLCVNTITSWAPKWQSKGWKKKNGLIKNLELVQELYALDRAHPHCSVEWIAAHAGNRWNEYADSLATAWSRDVL